MPIAERVGDRIHVTTEWNQKEIIKALPGSYWDSQLKIWTLPLTWASCAQLRGSFLHQFEAGPELTKWIWNEFNERIEPTMRLREMTQLD